MNSQSLFGPTGISVSELCDTTELAVEPTGRDAACARVTVTNSGAVAGTHVVQVYCLRSRVLCGDLSANCADSRRSVWCPARPAP